MKSFPIEFFSSNYDIWMISKREKKEPWDLHNRHFFLLQLLPDLPPQQLLTTTAATTTTTTAVSLT
jgi:hypothetical protein